ncbi:unnamed protein product [Discosporangium mesarthrocarpum]
MMLTEMTEIVSKEMREFLRRSCIDCRWRTRWSSTVTLCQDLTWSGVRVRVRVAQDVLRRGVAHRLPSFVACHFSRDESHRCPLVCSGLGPSLRAVLYVFVNARKACDTLPLVCKKYSSGALKSSFLAV